MVRITLGPVGDNEKAPLEEIDQLEVTVLEEMGRLKGRADILSSSDFEALATKHEARIARALGISPDDYKSIPLDGNMRYSHVDESYLADLLRLVRYVKSGIGGLADDAKKKDLLMKFFADFPNKGELVDDVIVYINKPRDLEGMLDTSVQVMCWTENPDTLKAATELGRMYSNGDGREGVLNAVLYNDFLDVSDSRLRQKIEAFKRDKVRELVKVYGNRHGSEHVLTAIGKVAYWTMDLDLVDLIADAAMKYKGLEIFTKFNKVGIAAYETGSPQAVHLAINAIN